MNQRQLCIYFLVIMAAVKVRFETCIRHGRDFSVGTTLAGGNAIRLMRNAKANKFEITMFYVGLGDYHLNIERVAAS